MKKGILIFGSISSYVIMTAIYSYGTRFETYIAITLMVLLVSLGLFINHLFRGFRKAI